MGHYLSDFETDDEYKRRTVYDPMYRRIKRYDEEVARGIMHTPAWRKKMGEERAILMEQGYWEVVR